MPIEIRELVIRARIEPVEEGGQGGNPPLQREELIAECVAQVLEVLRRRSER